MAKYLKKRKKRLRPLHIVLLAAALALVGAIIWMGTLYAQSGIPELSGNTEQSGATEQQESESLRQTEEMPEITIPAAEEAEPISLTNGLQITRIGSYAGMYVEDGSDEIVAGVMMILLENTTEQDLQLARIQIAYESFTAEFEATNLPAGATAVLLEKNRCGAVTEEPASIETKNVVFFPESMSLLAGTLEITGGEGYLDVTNISDTDVAGNIFIYYKNYSNGLYYGGITYRAKIEGGIPAGATMRVVTGHYTLGSCAVLQVTCEG